MKQDKPLTGRNGKFNTITGKDWDDSMKMVRSEPNLFLEQIRKKVAEIKQKQSCGTSPKA